MLRPHHVSVSQDVVPVAAEKSADVGEGQFGGNFGGALLTTGSFTMMGAFGGFEEEEADTIKAAEVSSRRLGEGGIVAQVSGVLGCTDSSSRRRCTATRRRRGKRRGKRRRTSTFDWTQCKSEVRGISLGETGICA